MNTLQQLLKMELSLQAVENLERFYFYNFSRHYCAQVGKPLLRIGVRRSLLEPPNGDVTLDVDPIVLKIPGGVLGDEREMPFASKKFGVCFNEHTLEHLTSAEDVALAIQECVRVADKAIFLCPSLFSFYSTFLCPTHFQIIRFHQGRVLVMPNKLRTGIGLRVDKAYSNSDRAILAQVLIVDGVVPIVRDSSARILTMKSSLL